jgi:hypothetical protein
MNNVACQACYHVGLAMLMADFSVNPLHCLFNIFLKKRRAPH